MYPVKINAGGLKHETSALAPISVLPNYQNKVIGSRLVKEGLKSAKRLGFNSVIVLGHPEYYPRFGFEHASKWGIKVPFDVPDEVFLATFKMAKYALHNLFPCMHIINARKALWTLAIIYKCARWEK